MIIRIFEKEEIILKDSEEIGRNKRINKGPLNKRLNTRCLNDRIDRRLNRRLNS